MSTSPGRSQRGRKNRRKRTKRDLSGNPKEVVPITYHILHLHELFQPSMRAPTRLPCLGPRGGLGRLAYHRTLTRGQWNENLRVFEITRAAKNGFSGLEIYFNVKCADDSFWIFEWQHSASEAGTGVPRGEFLCRLGRLCRFVLTRVRRRSGVARPGGRFSSCVCESLLGHVLRTCLAFISTAPFWSKIDITIALLNPYFSTSPFAPFTSPIAPIARGKRLPQLCRPRRWHRNEERSE